MSGIIPAEETSDSFALKSLWLRRKVKTFHDTWDSGGMRKKHQLDISHKEIEKLLFCKLPPELRSAEGVRSVSDRVHRPALRRLTLD